MNVSESSLGQSEIEEVNYHRQINLPDTQVIELTEAFKMFDLNGDGKISRHELGTVLRSLGESLTDRDLEQMIRDVDADGDGEIDLQEFINLNATESTRAAPSSDSAGDGEALQSAFNVFDSDKDGYISAWELHKVLSSLGDNHVSLDECRYMISCVDKDGDQLVDFHEFQILMSDH